MRILYLSLVDLSMSSGPSVNERGFLKDMALRFGDRFLALVPRTKRPLPKDLDDVSIEFISYVPGSKTIFGWLESRISGCFKAQLFINSFKPDVIVMRAGALALPQYVVARKNTSLPYFLKTAGGGDFNSFYNQNFMRRVISGINEIIFHFLIKNAQCIDVVSKMQVDSLSSCFPDSADKIFQIDNGVDTSLFNSEERVRVRERFGWGEQDVVLGYAGSQPYKRGAKELIHCVAAHKNEGVYGLVIGRLDNNDDCLSLTKSLGVEHLVTFTGEVDYTDVPDLMSTFDIGFSLLELNERSASEQKVRQYISTGAFVIGTHGSNDFLEEMSFASVLDDNIPELACEAVQQYLNMNFNVRYSLRNDAKNYAINHGSISKKNEERLALWWKYLAKD